MLSAAGTTASAATPNDRSFPLQWGDSNTGQSIPTQTAEGEEPLGPPANGTPGADDRALAAWKVSTGSRSIVIGELDTGVQYTHADLASNIWSNPGGVGGCPAGTHGFDALNSTCYPEDEDGGYGGHGTHVAGILGAVGNNGLGVAGLNWTTSILPVKWVQSAGSETDDLVDALKWLLAAKEEGVNIRVVNDSLTFFGTAYSTEVRNEIEALGKHNILFVTAAGNTGNNNDKESVRRYPCGYGLSNEICVTATNNRDELPRWAGYGAHTVDLAAPGVSIYSTLRGDRYGYLSGGSMASAQVAGAAALILSVEPTLTAQELKADILGNVRALPALKGEVITGGTLDICRAMPGCELPPRPSVTALAASSLTQTAATLRASVNPNGGEVSDCHFDYGNTSAYGENVGCAAMPGKGTRPVEVSAALSGLNPDTTYHFRIVASNAGGSASSADMTFTTPPEPPSVTALAASPVTQTAATLRASVNPNGGEVSDCHFDYGSTDAYGETARCVPLPGSATSPVEVTGSLRGLSPHVTYHFRIVASNAGGSSSSADMTFTTPPNPPSVVTQAASSVTQGSATLNALVNPEAGSVSNCQFEYGPTTGYGSSVSCDSLPGSGESPVAVSASISGLAPNATYHFRIVASNAGGTRRGADRFLTTPPSAPTVVSEAAASVTQSSAVLNATVNPNGGTVTACRFEYGLTSSYGSSVSCDSLPGSGEGPVAVSASIADLAANATYHFRIVAVNSGGTSDGLDRTFVSLPEAPSVVTEQASQIEGVAATLNAAVNPNGAAVSDCHFEYGTTTGHASSIPCASSLGTGSSPVVVSAPVTGLISRTTYRFHIVARNAGGTSEGAEATFTTTAKPAVFTEAPALVTQTSALLRASVNPNGEEVSDCHFDYGLSSAYGERTPCEPMPGSAVGAVEVTASIAGLTPSTPYHFRILATNSDGTSVGADFTLTTQLATRPQEAPPTTPPLPTGLQPAVLAGAVQKTTQQHAPAPPLPTLMSRVLTLSSSGLVRVILACPAGGETCAGGIVLRISADVPQHVASRARPHQPSSSAPLMPIARGRYIVAPGGAVSVTLVVSPRGRRLLAASHRRRGLADFLAGGLPAASLPTEVPVILVTSKAAHANRRVR